jgi:hypothetical protein
MTLPKKDSRPIEINGRSYRWMVRRCRNKDGVKPSLRLTVQDEHSGELLQRDFPEHVGYRTNEYGEQEPRPNTVTPVDVKAFIFERFPQP